MKPISWDKYFMSLAKISSFRSKDPNTKVGAVLVNEEKIVIGLGYNGMPLGNDKDFSWERKGSLENTKYPYVIHAEMNAILNSNSLIKNATLFVTLFPCSYCAKLCVQAGIINIIYCSDKYWNEKDNLISRNILKKSNVSFRKIDDFKINWK